MPLTPTSRINLARGIAAVADAIQMIIFPAFVAGLLEPTTIIVDVLVAATMIYLIGWHWAFLPSFMTELVPIADLAPTWTIAVFVATGIGGPSTAKDITPTDASSTPATPVTPVVVPPERSGPQTPPARQS
jgi:hypothetical protein